MGTYMWTYITWLHVLLFPAMHEHLPFGIVQIISQNIQFLRNSVLLFFISFVSGALIILEQLYWGKQNEEFSQQSRFL